MISIWRRLSQYWQSKGWMYLFGGAVFVLFVCWFLSDQMNHEGTYDRFELVDKAAESARREYFPQSLAIGNKKPGKNRNMYTESDDHVYKKSRSNIPTESKGEEICRATLQQIFKQPFPKVRPDFLFNSVTGENLEFDMYNKHYGLAVEYNGQQHYKFNKFMHQGSRDRFYGQQYRDKMKADICKKLNITLIEVPYTVKHQEIPNFLVQELRKHRFIE